MRVARELRPVRAAVGQHAGKQRIVAPEGEADAGRDEAEGVVAGIIGLRFRRVEIVVDQQAGVTVHAAGVERERVAELVGRLRGKRDGARRHGPHAGFVIGEAGRDAVGAGQRAGDGVGGGDGLVGLPRDDAVGGVLGMLVELGVGEEADSVVEFEIEPEPGARTRADVSEILHLERILVGRARGAHRQLLEILRRHVDDRAVRAVGEIEVHAEPAEENLRVGQRGVGPRDVTRIGGAPDRADTAADAALR